MTDERRRRLHGGVRVEGETVTDTRAIEDLIDRYARAYHAERESPKNAAAAMDARAAVLAEFDRMREEQRAARAEIERLKDKAATDMLERATMAMEWSS